MPRENADWGYDRIAGALKNLGHDVSDQTVGDVTIRRNGDKDLLRPMSTPAASRCNTGSSFCRLRRLLGIQPPFLPVEPPEVSTKYELLNEFVTAGRRTVRVQIADLNL